MGHLSDFIASKNQPKRGFESMSSTLLFAIGVIITFVGIVLIGYGIFKILDTTPFMGIIVDAQGNRLPNEGYPFFWVGLAVTAIGSILCFIAGFNILQRREFAVIVNVITGMRRI
jgi:hypothetical protein